MRLVRLIADFQLIQTRLAYSIKHETPVSSRAALMRRAAILMDDIEAYAPANESEARQKIDFFLTRARQGATRCDGQRDLGIAMSLISRFGAPGTAVLPCNSRSALPWEVLDRLAGRGATRDELAAFLRNLSDRATLLDRSFRHICTSRGNAGFHNRAPGDFVGLHMSDLIGRHRFDTRGHGQMSHALGGRKLGYYYPLEVPALGTRVIQCTMRPWIQGSGETAGLILWMNDVTDRLTDAHGFGEIPLAASDGGPGPAPK